MKPIVLIAGAGLILLAGLAIGWQVKPMPDPTYRDVVVTDPVIVAQQPETVLKFVDRIRWKVAEPTVIARGDTPDTTRLDAYCRPDSGNITASLPPSTPVLPPSSGKYDGTTLALYSVTSDGRLFAQETRATAPIEWVNRGGVYEVRETRKGFQLFRALPKVLLPFAAGMATGIILAK